MITLIAITTWLDCCKESIQKNQLYELVPAFICTSITESLVNSLLGVKILIPVLYSTCPSSTFSGGIDNKSIKLLSFGFINQEIYD